jgi:hypothetical protein
MQPSALRIVPVQAALFPGGYWKIYWPMKISLLV